MVLDLVEGHLTQPSLAESEKLTNVLTRRGEFLWDLNSQHLVHLLKF